MRLPNFIIFAALKSGTTSMYRYLSEHPEIYMPILKEPRFFAYDDDNPELRQKPEKAFPIRTLKDYSALFDGVTNEKAIGEASPNYLESPIAARNIKACIPDVILIASLRNPVDRLYSDYLMKVRSGNETRSFEQALNSHSHPLRLNFYYENMKRYFDHFNRSKIKVVLFEEFSSDTHGVIGDIFRFLDVDDSFVPNLSVRHHKGGVPRSTFLNRMLNLPHKYMNPQKQMIMRSIVPKRLRDFISMLRSRNLQEAPPLPSDIRNRLVDYFHSDILKLQDLLERDLSVWLKKL